MSSESSALSAANKLLEIQTNLKEAGFVGNQIAEKVHGICMSVISGEAQKKSLNVVITSSSPFKFQTTGQENVDITKFTSEILTLYHEYERLPKDQQKKMNLEILKQNCDEIADYTIAEYEKNEMPESAQKIEQLKEFQKEFHSQQKEEALIEELKNIEDSPENKDKIKDLLKQMSYPIHGAILAGKGSIEVIVELINDGADINGKDAKDKTPLYYICQEEAIDKILAFIDIPNVDLNATESDASTLLVDACAHGMTEVVKKLIEKNVNLNVKTTEGETPILCACNNHHYKVILELLATGKIDLTARDEDDLTVIDYIQEYNEDQRSEFLEEIAQKKNDPSFPPEILDQIENTLIESENVTPKETSIAKQQATNYQDWAGNKSKSSKTSEINIFAKHVKSGSIEKAIEALDTLTKSELNFNDVKLLASAFNKLIDPKKGGKQIEIFNSLPFILQLHVTECMENQINRQKYTEQLQKNARNLKIAELEDVLKYLTESKNVKTPKTNLLPREVQVIHTELHNTLLRAQNIVSGDRLIKSPTSQKAPSLQPSKVTLQHKATRKPMAETVATSVTKSFVPPEIHELWSQRTANNIIKPAIINDIKTEVYQNYKTKEIDASVVLDELRPSDAQEFANFFLEKTTTQGALNIFNRFSLLNQLHIVEMMNNNSGLQQYFKALLISNAKKTRDPNLSESLITYLGETRDFAKKQNSELPSVYEDILEILKKT